jgi:16S rRNA (guanine527-N7)-methyltransferase
MRDATISRAIDRSLSELAFTPRPESAAALAKLAEMVEMWGARMNLTGHRSALEITQSLIADAIGLLGALENHVRAELAGRVIDLGSGAGFPGLPWAIVRPLAEVHMVEAREKRHYFQRAACREIGIPNAHPVHARIEALPLVDGDWVVAQAVGPIEEVIRAMRPFARVGGRLVVPGSERLTSPAGVADLGGEIVSYRSPLLDQPRRIWVGRRPATTTPA